MPLVARAPFGAPPEVFLGTLDTLSVSLTLRRATGGAWAEVGTALDAILDFTPSGFLRAQQAGMSPALTGEAGGMGGGLAAYVAPNADVKIGDTFAHSGGLYRVGWVGPAGASIDGSGSVLKTAWCIAQKSPGVG